MLENTNSLIANSKLSSELSFENFLDIVLMLEVEYPDFYQSIRDTAINVYGVSFIVPVR